MRLRFGRILIAAVIAESVPIILLIALVALFGPREQVAAQSYAERLGQWVGPIGGTLMCLLAAWWLARSLSASHLIHGLMVGLAAALIDIALAYAAGAAFQWIFVASNLGRVLGGAVGGVAGRRAPAPLQGQEDI